MVYQLRQSRFPERNKHNTTKSNPYCRSVALNHTQSSKLEPKTRREFPFSQQTHKIEHPYSDMPIYPFYHAPPPPLFFFYYQVLRISSVWNWSPYLRAVKKMDIFFRKKKKPTLNRHTYHIRGIVSGFSVGGDENSDCTTWFLVEYNNRSDILWHRLPLPIKRSESC